MTTEEAFQEALEEWACQFMVVADDVSSYCSLLIDAPDDQVPYELLNTTMDTMQSLSRLLRAASDELFPLDDDLLESIAKMFESSAKAKPTPVKASKPGESRG